MGEVYQCLSMFKDLWLPRGNFFKPTCTNSNLIDEKVSEFITLSGEWDIQRLKDTMLSTDVETIRQIPLNRNLEDKII